jgi:aerobic carbon-monoxide dehydrogenase medium subunit
MVVMFPEFTYIRPSTIQEAISALAARGSSARLIAGGTDLMLLLRDGTIAPEFVIDLHAISELRRLEQSPAGGLTVGAAVTLRSLETSPTVRRFYPLLSESAGEIGSVQVRNLGTVGGNLCTAMPSADLAPALMTLGASIRIVGGRGERVVPVERFFAGPRQSVLDPGEVLVDVSIPPPAPRSGGVYLKMANRPTMDITFVGVAATVALSVGSGAAGARIETARIALAAVAPTPIRAYAAEDLLAGRSPDPSTLETCAAAAADACQPISDARATAAYRREMVAVLTKRAVAIAVERAKASTGTER